MLHALVHADRLEGRPIRVYERSVTAPNPALYGIPTTSVVETYDIWEAPDWPTVRIRARRGLAPLLSVFGRRPGLVLDLPAFTANFRVDATDEEFAIALLSPEMQGFLLEKRTVDWSVGMGAIRLYHRGRLRRWRVSASLDRLRRFWALLPPEIADWPMPEARHDQSSDDPEDRSLG